MLPSVERFFRAFGGRQTPYLHVSRASAAAALALTARSELQRLQRLARRCPDRTR